MNENQKVRFACYGTLKKNHGNFHYVKDAEYLGEHITEPLYTMYTGGFPVTERGGNTAIHCEIYETSDPEIIKDVHGLEGCESQIQGHPSNWYDFDLTQTAWGDARIFVMDKGKSRRTQIVSSGKWH